MQQPITVIVCGARGRMGQETVAAVSRDPELRLVGATVRTGEDGLLRLPGGGSVPLSSDLAGLLARTRAQVVVDFTRAEAAVQNARIALQGGAHFVTGTTGIPTEEIAEIGRLAERQGLGAVVAPNFAVGAVLAMAFARMAARHFDYAEIIELHHEKKADAPSGTAIATARMMREARGRDFLETEITKETLPGPRGAALGGVRLHSVRLPGLVAHQEVILGGLGQTLTIRHDSTSRESFMPGVILAIKEVVRRPGLTLGIEPLLGL
jgi:4-hydroxy-tetrahydrodipicolinate reductase